MLEGKNIVVSGSLQGIGKETVSFLAQSGCNIWACAHYLTDEYLAFCEALASRYNVSVTALTADYSDLDSVKAMTRKILKEKVKVDGIVHIAGIANDAMFAMTSSASLSDTYKINVTASLVLTQGLARSMLKHKGGSIVFTSSISAIDGNEGQLAYASSKAALIGAMKTLSKELGVANVRVNSISPGVINTDMNKAVPKDIIDEKLGITSLRRVGEPIEVSKVIAFLMSDLSSYVTGQNIRIDGGMA
jgi:3-oxoacyl-[acyl-carrier protein] reductase